MHLVLELAAYVAYGSASLSDLEFAAGGAPASPCDVLLLRAQLSFPASPNS